MWRDELVLDDIMSTTSAGMVGIIFSGHDEDDDDDDMPLNSRRIILHYFFRETWIACSVLYLYAVVNEVG